jgi:UPF0755 protein
MRRLGLLALLGIAALGAFAGWMDSQISRPYRGHRPERVFVDIPHGTSRWGAARILRKNDVIRNRLAFALLSEWHGRHKLQAGEYLFDEPINSREVFWKIARGKIFVHTVLVPEGWTMFEIAGEVSKQGICGREDFLQAAHDTGLISDLAPHAQSLEGFLFPSTYEFTRHTTCDEIVKRMVDNFRAVWESLPPRTSAPDSQNMTPQEIVTLASLIERETPDAEERPVVSGVFYNRLKRDYPLQCDPTVQYALELEGRTIGDVRPEDLRIDSPYNTYRHHGLPPGPIANPGEASLRAALTPQQTDYLYFVANNQGGHFFGKTLAEHNRNVARLRRLLLDSAAASDPAPAR